MTDFNDPLTGEKVQGSINEWEAVLDTRVAVPSRISSAGSTARSATSRSPTGSTCSSGCRRSQLGSAQYTPSVLSTKEIQSRLASIDQLERAAQRALARARRCRRGVLAQTAAQNLSSALGPSLDSKFQSATQTTLGSQWEAQLVTPNMLQMAGLNPHPAVRGRPHHAGHGVARCAGSTPRLAKWSSGVMNSAQIYKDMCVSSDMPEPDSLVGLARQANKLFPLPAATDPNYPAELFQRDQSLHEWIREQFHLSVIAHEMGHSMGLRHNFTGSFDALNYHTEYWQIRTRNGAEHYCGFPGALDATTPHTNGTDCVGPRWVDPVTDQEVNDAIWKWGSTTVMDYPGDNTQDMNDIGSYDKAAMRFGYADIVDVEKNKKYSTLPTARPRARASTTCGSSTASAASSAAPSAATTTARTTTNTVSSARAPRAPGWTGSRERPAGDAVHGAGPRLRRGARHALGRPVHAAAQSGERGRSSRTSRSTRRGACATRTCSGATSSPTSATCPSSGSTPAPTRTSRCSFSSRPTRTGTSSTTFAATS